MVLPTKNENKVYFCALLAFHVNGWAVVVAQGGAGAVHGVRGIAGLKQYRLMSVLMAVPSYSRLLEMELRSSKTIKPKLVMPEETPQDWKRIFSDDGNHINTHHCKGNSRQALSFWYTLHEEISTSHRDHQPCPSIKNTSISFSYKYDLFDPLIELQMV